QAVLHSPGDDGIDVAPKQKRWRLDPPELAQVVVLQEFRECLLPDSGRNLEELRHQQIDQLRAEVSRRSLREKGPCEIRRYRVLKVGHDGLDRADQLRVVTKRRRR